eukprot:CAMPEP_0173274226 /NCGR_PEP_ID=MMETSP1143-20121109/2330_1 /TAXON_ID=483371 /ORGANISM="non described non described, Strain CCMP2298" /LENGTH=360 /DNA_ID=CAMNT_0014211029 /DNA_START=440 /DNA_END=1519 /DNA_ORIENTATION=+
MKRVGSGGSGGGFSCILIAALLLVLGYGGVFFYVFDKGGCEKTPELLQLGGEIKAQKEELEILRAELERLKSVPEPTPVVAMQTPVRPGLVVLGMHRSGTSVIGGLLSQMGLKTGGPLIGAAADNAKGFFERIDVVLQNDYLMRNQKINYAGSTWKYDHKIGIRDILNDSGTGGKGTFFREGKRGLAFLNDPGNYPWMLKDPRLCITLRTWLPVLNFVPAVLFTYRHPMDVALSFLNRYEHFKIARSLIMWYVYNKRAIQQSQDLCRVTTSHSLIMTQPLVETDRIFDQLRACGVLVPKKLTLSEVSNFVDPKLQHGKNALKDNPCLKDLSTLIPPDSWKTVDAGHLTLYREVIRAFCAM